MMIDPKWLRMMAIYSGAAMVKVALFLGAFFGGMALDKKFHTEPFFLILGILAAMVLGTWYVIMLTKRKL